MTPRPLASGWTLDDAERHLLSLEFFGMRFGLDRMRRLLNVLGNPQLRFASVHIVGTNGKSSTTRMTAALLGAEGLRVGAYTSPHLLSYAERVQVGGRDIEPQHFADAVAQAVRAAELVNRSGDPDDTVTQFELLTAAAYAALAQAGVEVAVVEAGLGGRYDATNVIESRVQVLTNVGLEHTRWLGPTVADIAKEKLDVVRPGGVLVLGPDLHPDALALAQAIASERGATIMQASTEPDRILAAGGAYQRANFAVALAAATAFLQHAPAPEAVARAAAEVVVPGRFQVIAQSPTTLLDGAHNQGGMEALVGSLPEFVGGRDLVGVVAILDDKDAAGMLGQLAPVCSSLVLTSTSNPRTLSPATLESLAGQLHIPRVEVVADPWSALEQGRKLAGPDGVVLATGSIYLVSDLLRGRSTTRRSML